MTSRGTTPTYIFEFPEDIDLTEAEEIILTLTDGRYNKLLEADTSSLDVEEHQISLYLTQEQTLALPIGTILCQANITFMEGSKKKRVASTIERISSAKNLHEEVI